MLLEFVIAVILSQVVLGLFLWYQVRDLYRFPNYFGFPVFGNLYYFYKGLCFKSLHTLYTYQKEISDKVGNGIFFAYIKGRPSVVLSCPYIVEEIAYNPNASEKAHNVYGTVNKLIKGIFMYCPIDSEWKLRRKETNNSLSKTLVDGFYSEIFKNMGRELAKVFKTHQDNVDLIFHCTFASINAVLFTHCGVEKPLPEKRRFFHTWTQILEFISLILSNPLVSLVFSFTYKLFDKFLMKRVDLLINQVGGSLRGKLKNVLKDPSTESKFLPLSVVIALRIKNRKLSGFELNKELYEMLVAGSHTASVILTGCFAYMATLPEIQEKVWREQYEIFGTSDRDPNLEDLRKMTYMDKFIKEILRFFSPGFIAKHTTGEVKAGGVTIPAGIPMYFLLGKLRNDTKFWDDPQVFNPERAFDDKPKFSHAAFGVGIRSCPGMLYAKQELKIVLSIIIRNFKLSSQQKYEDFRYESHLMPEIKNLKPIQVEQRMCN
ncbi:cytochrome P450 4c21 [Halyomorpha halys]|uniref:cytochrome P450 4c21 n=1 Tax=Halyomorpha halys TaxID=286706 RepID=UPI0006D50961|nr:cytochrome P450 4c21-like [Halyomorpha halys]